jgi:hypothetical protein
MFEPVAFSHGNQAGKITILKSGGKGGICLLAIFWEEKARKSEKIGEPRDRRGFFGLGETQLNVRSARQTFWGVSK